MINDKGIYIKNIYYMLSYAFQVLKQTNYESVAAEEFNKIEDLFAAILAKGIAKQLKQGLYREYVVNHDTLSVMKGKVDLQETIRLQIKRKQMISCEYDELSENNLFNQILKTTMHYLIMSKGVDQEHKIALTKLFLFFDGVDLLSPSSILWNRLHYHKNSKNYEMLLNICYLVMDGMLQTTEAGEYKMSSFSDEHMAKLFEKFILEYYRCERKDLSDARAAKIKWNLDSDSSKSMISFLPEMQSDIFLRKDEKVLIIDAKYYGKTMQYRNDKKTLHSSNLYQIFTYVKNQDKENTGNVSGMLVYAKTQENYIPTEGYQVKIGGNQIGAITLDLNKDFEDIKKQLDDIAIHFLG
ncbi:5-methylcytosine-specific restriction endonuclease system specificity protein McrC [Succinivibrio faecicola]|uniref:5-methylcytosine-specific restriction endonuclease system specificity protein McrC n=1 Tax=Succinivibrio faecicola TaxID=2820300 RepID=A0ABS7DHL4_9GAMM|nr:5-methylcytosine-specific restriction endonuclease system specificity protein McrC [Succinivibrio faecicola]MBW7570784.1 5-methylcytosine-specific restriction endonuclease system specificity protein McrC [Succinivibrio faecicola]